MYFQTILQFKKHLGQLDKWLETAAKFAEAKRFDSSVWLGLRLAPDQFPFSRQVQTVCDTAKLTASRLTGKEAPKNEDNEKTIEELRARIASTLAYLSSFSASDFEHAATREITQPRWEGKKMTGANYFLEHAVPNFYFHLTTVYALLRTNGVDIGKRDYLGQLTFEAT